jgi:hypothetical protein
VAPGSVMSRLVWGMRVLAADHELARALDEFTVY